MSGTTETQRPGQEDRSSSSDALSVPGDQDTYQPDAASNGNRKAQPSDKTISCVSCRKRKLKCDRIKPKCATCSRLNQACEYPERKRNVGSKRRNMRELEARLAEVETLLVSDSKAGSSVFENVRTMENEPVWATLGMDMDMNMDMNMNMDMDMGDIGIMDPSYDMPQPGLGNLGGGSAPSGDFFSQSSQELLGLGLEEPLPPQDMIDELETSYFDNHHKTMPILHKYRYYASCLDRCAKSRVPVCLRYAIWTMAASCSEKYSTYQDIFYERTRRYLQNDEMKGHGEVFVTIRHVQSWSIIATYEAKKTYFSRSWMSTGRATRLAHMLGLHRLDWDGAVVKRILAPPRDWIEWEERRRTFWGVYYCDRWASSGTGWPMVIDEKEILTNLPSSEEAFESGVPETAPTLAEALTPEGAPRVSPFGGVVLSATLFGHNFEHLHQTGPNEHPEDLANGDFWKRHRQMDNVLSNTFMFLPDHLRLPAGARDMNVIFLHMNIHASAICLQQAAIMTAEKHNIDKKFVRQCRSRCMMAAEEILNIMRMVLHVDFTKMNAWTGFCLYVAGGVYIQGVKHDLSSHSQTRTSLEFLISAMKALGSKHSITDHFTSQLELDMQVAGLSGDYDASQSATILPNIPINGLLAEREGLGMTMENICSFAGSPLNRQRGHLPSSQYGANGADQIQATFPVGVAVLARGSTEASPNGGSSTTSPLSDWEVSQHSSFPGQKPSENPNKTAYSNFTQPTGDTGTRSGSMNEQQNLGSSSGFSNRGGFYGDPAQSCPYEKYSSSTIDPLPGNTPPSDTSTPNPMNFPFRQADFNSQVIDGRNKQAIQPEVSFVCRFVNPVADWHGTEQDIPLMQPSDDNWMDAANNESNEVYDSLIMERTMGRPY